MMQERKYSLFTDINCIKNLKLDSLSHSSEISVLIRPNTPTLHYSITQTIRYSNTPANSKEHLRPDHLHPSAVEVIFQYHGNGAMHAQI
jgi:hypothetical protein